MLRVTYLTAAIIVLLLMPLGSMGVLLVLFVAADLGAAPLILRSFRTPAATVVPFGGDAANVALLRRTVPELRMRRPAGAIDAQIRWRQAAEAAQRRRRDSAPWSAGTD